MTARFNDPDGADVIALARAVGLSGIRPADSVADTVPSAALPTPTPLKGNDIVALARSVGLSGVRPATTVLEKQALAKFGDQELVGVSSSSPPSLSAANDGSPPGRAADPLYVRLRIIGTTGFFEAEKWESEHGSLSAPTEKGDVSLRRKHNGGWTEVLFRVPDDGLNREALNRAAGAVTSTYFQFHCLKKVDLTGFRFEGAGVAGLPTKFLASREPPVLPDALLAGLIASGAQ